ncbi:MAG: hypothetical protein R3244_10150 [Thermoanaerobaculia bacterium]|nr:hypothetical protein [Thermoanaerobaculia bacterium]
MVRKPVSGDELAVIKQVAAKMTSFGFSNAPFNAKARDEARHLGENTSVWVIDGLTEAGAVYALVVHKGHSPLEAHHVVDFRIGQDIY